MENSDAKTEETAAYNLDAAAENAVCVIGTIREKEGYEIKDNEQRLIDVSVDFLIDYFELLKTIIRENKS